MKRPVRLNALGCLVCVVLMLATLSARRASAVAATGLQATWTQMTPSGDSQIDPSYVATFPNSLPGTRGWFQMAFDSRRNVTVLFGGSGGSYKGAYNGYTNQMWYYDGSADRWTLVGPEVNCPNSDAMPNGRDNHELIYDDLNDLYWMFGGTGWQCGRSSDGIIRTGGLWSFDPSQRTWHLWYPGGTPSVEGVQGSPACNEGAYDPGFAYSPFHRKIVKVGGELNSDMSTWIFDVVSKTWTDSGIRGVIPYRDQTENALVYDEYYNVFVFFGGGRESAGIYYNDTWVYSLESNTWTKMNPPVSPPAREQHAMVYDPVNHVTVLFGGNTGGSFLNDTWVYDYGANTWTNVTPADSPPPVCRHGMAYDRSTNRIIAFKGHTDQAWGTWSLRLTSGGSSDTTPPAARRDLIAR